MKIYPLITGTHQLIQAPQGVSLPGHTGAVTLLIAGSEKILVDVGARGMFDVIKDKLLQHGLTPEDITLIILTHLHLDHGYNLALFPQARVLAFRHDWRKGETFRYADIEQISLPEGMRLIKTPGHAEEHLAVLAEEDGKVTVIAGDAVNEKYARTGEVDMLFYDEPLYRRSAEKILAAADVIIPGHGPPFPGKRGKI